MPNWSANRLYVSGKPEHVKEFTDTLGGEDRYGEKRPFSFHQTVPMPKEGIYMGEYNEEIKCHMVSYDAERDVIDCLQWSSQNWGTKWDANYEDYDVDVDEIQKHVQEAIDKGEREVVIDIGFSTAWAPPIAWMASASKKFPELNFVIAYSECGMDYYGTATAIGGLCDEETIGGCDMEEVMETFINSKGEEEEFEAYMPSGNYADFLEFHSIGTGG
jgi:hypothetical protein